MYRVLEYSIFFMVMILLQTLLFDNLNLTVYIHPLVYITFIILLPMETPAIAVLLLGLLTGVTMDFMTGGAGLYTIATLPVAFCRSFLLGIIAGRDEMKEGGIPLVARLGTSKFLRYSSAMVFLHCLLYFTFEALTWQYYYLTLLRVVSSAAVTAVLVYFSQMLLVNYYSKPAG